MRFRTGAIGGEARSGDGGSFGFGISFEFDKSKKLVVGFATGDLFDGDAVRGDDMRGDENNGEEIVGFVSVDGTEESFFGKALPQVPQISFLGPD